MPPEEEEAEEEEAEEESGGEDRAEEENMQPRGRSSNLALEPNVNVCALMFRHQCRTALEAPPPAATAQGGAVEQRSPTGSR